MSEQWIPTAQLRWNKRYRDKVMFTEISHHYYKEEYLVLQQMMVNATTGEREWQDVPTE